MAFLINLEGALDVRAKEINEEMKIIAAKAIAMLARDDVPDEVVSAYGGEIDQSMERIILFHQRLIQDLLSVIPAAVINF